MFPIIKQTIEINFIKEKIFGQEISEKVAQ